MDLRRREKLLSVLLVCKDILKTIINIFCATILFCAGVDNGWFSPVIDGCNITNIEFWKLFQCLLILIPFITFYHALNGKYIVIIKEHAAENKEGVAKLQRFRRIK